MKFKFGFCLTHCSIFWPNIFVRWNEKSRLFVEYNFLLHDFMSGEFIWLCLILLHTTHEERWTKMTSSSTKGIQDDQSVWRSCSRVLAGSYILLVFVFCSWCAVKNVQTKDSLQSNQEESRSKTMSLFLRNTLWESRLYILFFPPAVSTF